MIQNYSISKEIQEIIVDTIKQKELESSDEHRNENHMIN